MLGQQVTHRGSCMAVMVARPSSSPCVWWRVQEKLEQLVKLLGELGLDDVEELTDSEEQRHLLCRSVICRRCRGAGGLSAPEAAWRW